MLDHTKLIGSSIALGIILLVALGLFGNPKPEPVPPQAEAVTHAVAEKAGAKITPTINQ
jgi:hypothetical protein